MARFLQPAASYSFHLPGRLLLGCVWTAGLLLGGAVSYLAGDGLASGIPLAASCPPSLPGLLSVCLLPLLFAGFAVYLRAPRLLYVVCFGKAFLFSYVCWGVLRAFGAGGWLVRNFLLFTDLLGVIALYHYSLRHISGLRCFSGRCLGLYCCVLAVGAGVDLSIVSPLLRRFLS